jgi:hypothetical protein
MTTKHKPIFPPVRKSRPAIDKRSPASDVEHIPPEALSGMIQGKVADSAAEERFAQSLAKDPRVMNYWYKLEDLVAPKGMPGWKQLDFLVQSVGGQYTAVAMADLTFVHHGAASNSTDALDSMLFKNALASQGINIDQVQWLDASKYDTQEASDQQVRDMMI